MIKTMLLFAYVAISAIILFPFGLFGCLMSLLGMRTLAMTIFNRIGSNWARLLIFLTGCDVTVTGRENIPEKGSICLVSNHCGYFDIVLLLAYCTRSFGFVAKKELLFLPFINVWILMLGGLFINRGDLRKAVKTIGRGVDKIKKGGGLLIFPEGSRSKGTGLLPFRPGSLKLATMAQAPIVPVAIEGSYDVYEKNKRVEKTTVKIAFLPKIDTADLPPEDKKLVLSDRIYRVIEEQLSRFKGYGT